MNIFPRSHRFGKCSRRLGLTFLACLVAAAGCGMFEEPLPVEVEKPAKQVDGTVLRRLEAGSYFQGWQLDDGELISFSIRVPELYDHDKPAPLVLSLHFGAREFRQFFGNEMMQGLVAPAVSDLNAIIVAPDVINRSWTNLRCEESVMALMQEVCETYNIDRERILVVGYSMGAEGVWHFAGKHPDFFTGAIPIAGRPVDNYQETDWTVPMLAIHSGSDEIYPFRKTRQAVQAIEARGGNVRLVPLENISHYQSAKYIEPFRETVDRVRQIWDAGRKKLPPE